MDIFSGLQKSRSATIFRWLVFLCLMLVSVAAIAQAMHFHSDQAARTTNHCSICLVMHSAAVTAHHVQLDSSFQSTGYLHVSENSARISSSGSFALFSRPPPLA